MPKLIGWVVACLALLPGARAAESPSAPPEVLVLVSAAPNGTDNVSIAYARAVTEKVARAELDALLRAAGWKAEGVRVDTERLIPSQPATTTVEFTAPMVVPYREGVLPVAPMVEAYRHYRSLVLVFQPQRPFRFYGPTSYQDRFVTIRYEQAPGSYRYDVLVTDPSFRSLSLPTLPRDQGANPGTATRRRPSPIILALLALGAAAGVGVAVYLLVASRMGGTQSPQRRG